MKTISERHSMRRQELELDKLPCREEVLQHNTGMHHHQQKRLVALCNYRIQTKILVTKKFVQMFMKSLKTMLIQSHYGDQINHQRTIMNHMLVFKNSVKKSQNLTLIQLQNIIINQLMLKLKDMVTEPIPSLETMLMFLLTQEMASS